MSIQPLPIRYVVDLSRPGHEIVVRATFEPTLEPDGSVRVFMPRWAPGSYLLREFARHVDWIRATQAGSPLEVTKTSTDEWSISG